MLRATCGDDHRLAMYRASRPAEYGLLFGAYLRPFAGEDSHIYVGKALGIDTLALDWLTEHTPAAPIVVVPRKILCH
jgi:hypothetical protein